MPPSPPPLLLPFLLHLLLHFLASASHPISLPLRRTSLPPHPDPRHRLAALASASYLRASLLKNPIRHSSPPPATSPLFPHSYGGYSFGLTFGTPPQELQLLLDTGSHITWVPCTPSYQCRSCASPSGNTIIVFLPRSSSSVAPVGCRNPRCLWIHSADFLRSRCPSCNNATSDCPASACPPYSLIYGSGSTAGLFVLETMSFSNLTFPNFTVGCSIISERQPSGGIAGFGRSAPSLPSQIGLKRFSYCLISRRYDDDASESGSLVLDPPKEDSSDGLSSTPFLNNSAAGAVEGSPFSVYYYVGLREIAVGGEQVKIPYSALVPGPTGEGGVIVDSGTTFTYMAPHVFNPVLAAFVDRVAGRYNRSKALEDQTGLRPCFALPPHATDVELPELTFRFKGGAEMRLPLKNYFAFVNHDDAGVCLTIISDGNDVGTSNPGDGPAVILGSFQQQDYLMVYDLERGRLGFRRQSCLTN
ncbi:probable aspartyl protease At4g16563 [Zingiber officinale]|uniref:Peptidase A1 domain-containing protein n=1 Tax=Zingiber officinale TaxID=94328 RepID=A0A8J5LBW6_ZINOF|nr:probable aspartyl protease At4g16563 [Zingiber officinale]KAG6522672.1 hypothetical protein ZIOFF_019819 [Zingiber officinale]